MNFSDLQTAQANLDFAKAQLVQGMRDQIDLACTISRTLHLCLSLIERESQAEVHIPQEHFSDMEVLLAAYGLALVPSSEMLHHYSIEYISSREACHAVHESS